MRSTRLLLRNVLIPPPHPHYAFSRHIIPTRSTFYATAWHCAPRARASRRCITVTPLVPRLLLPYTAHATHTCTAPHATPSHHHKTYMGTYQRAHRQMVGHIGETTFTALHNNRRCADIRILRYRSFHETRCSPSMARGGLRINRQARSGRARENSRLLQRIVAACVQRKKHCANLIADT